MTLPDAPIALEGFYATHFFTVKDQEKSKDIYVRILGGKVIKSKGVLPDQADGQSRLGMAVLHARSRRLPHRGRTVYAEGPGPFQKTTAVKPPGSHARDGSIQGMEGAVQVYPERFSGCRHNLPAIDPAALQNIKWNVDHQADVPTRRYPGRRGCDGPQCLHADLDVSVEEGERTLAEVGSDEDLSTRCGLNGSADSGGAGYRVAPVCGHHYLDETADLNPAAQQRHNYRLLTSCLEVDDIAGVVEGDASLERAFAPGRVVGMMGAGDGERKLMLGAKGIQRVCGSRGGLESARHEGVTEDDLCGRSAACLHISLAQVYEHFLTVQIGILAEYAQGAIRDSLDCGVLAVEHNLIAYGVADLRRGKAMAVEPAIDVVEFRCLAKRDIVLKASRHERKPRNVIARADKRSAGQAARHAGQENGTEDASHGFCGLVSGLRRDANRLGERHLFSIEQNVLFALARLLEGRGKLMLFKPLPDEDHRLGSGTSLAHRLTLDAARLRGQISWLSHQKHAGSMVGGAFRAVTGAAHGVQRFARGAGVLLGDMRQLMRQQPFSGGRPRTIAASAEYDVAANGVCIRMQCVSGGRRPRVSVDAHIGQVFAQIGFVARSNAGIQRHAICL